MLILVPLEDRTVLEFTNSVNPVFPIVVFHCDEPVMVEKMVVGRGVENGQETLVENFCKKSEETPLADLNRQIRRRTSRSENGEVFSSSYFSYLLSFNKSKSEGLI